MKVYWNGLTITAIEPSISDYLQPVAEDVEYEEMSECEMIEAKEDERSSTYVVCRS